MTSSQNFDAPVQADVVPVDVDTEIRVGLSEMLERGHLPFGDVVAAVTESPLEASIDARNGLRHHGGRKPVEADFEDIFVPLNERTDAERLVVVNGPVVPDETVQPGGALV